MSDGAVFGVFFISFFALIFGVIYYFLQTRHKERMSLIEHGAEAKLFTTGVRKSNYFFAMMIGIVFVCLALGIGTGAIMDESRLFIRNEESVYFVSIFFFIGVGFITSFFLHKKMVLH